MEEKTISRNENRMIEVTHILKNSSIHAVSQFGHSQSIFRKIFWIFVLIFGIVGCTYDMHRWLQKYFQYPVLINMVIENPLKMEFPAVTVCNLNRMKSEYESCLKQGLPSSECPGTRIRTRILVFSERKKILLNPETTLSEKEEIQKSQNNLQEETVLFMQRYSNLDVISRELYGYRYFDLIRRCSFDSSSCDFENFTLFRDLQFGNCLTFNKQKGQTPLMSYHTGPDYGLEIEIDPLENTYLDITPNVGFLVVVHNNDENPNVAEDGIHISPGFETHLSIKISSIKRLPAPYRDKCYNYNTSAINATIRSELDCVRMCIQEVSLSSCSCVDPFLPTLKHMEKCALKNVSAMSCLDDVLNKMAEYGLPCSCPLPCQVTSYDVQISSSLLNPYPYEFTSSVPNDDDGNGGGGDSNSFECLNSTESEDTVCDLHSDDMLMNDDINSKESQPKQRKSLLKVFFKNFEHKIYSQEPTFTETELYSYLGGHLSFWLGLSLLAIFECIQNSIFFLKFLLIKRY